MPISFETSNNVTERRRRGRARLAIDVSIRERSRSAMTARLADLNSFGCCLAGVVTLVDPNAQAWVRLPGLESVPVRLVWRQDDRCGLEFITPLHPAVAARFMPAEGSHAAAAVIQSAVAEDQLSRREQIMAGIAGSDLSPLQRKKKPSGMGMVGKINRLVSRQADTRAEPRFSDAVPQDTVLEIEGCPAQVLDVSSAGMRIRAELGSRHIGAQVAVGFAGFEPLSGQLVWLNGSEAGIALAPGSIELFERAG